MKTFLCSIFTLFLIPLVHAQISSESQFSIGEILEINSRILQEERTVNIYLPNGYERDTEKTYPVIYLLDGSADEDFIHIAGIVQFCSFSWINILPESIVVSIANVDRKRDFTSPSDVEIDQREFPTSGKSGRFIAFIAEELQGIISEKYRTTNTKTLIGQSLGGLLATEILFKRPGLFDNYIIISPSLWWNDERLLKYDLDKSLKNKSVYIGVGKEGGQMEKLAQSLFHKLTLEKKDEVQLYFNQFEGQSHGDVLHLAVYDAFEKLFTKKK